MNHQYHFSYISSHNEVTEYPVQTNQTKTIYVSEDSAWPVVMREFANFMSGIYGYDITEKLLIEEWNGDHARLNDYGV